MKPRSDASYAAVRRGHKRTTAAHLWTLDGGYDQPLPFSEGQLEFSLSRSDGVRSGRITVPGYQWYALCEPGRKTYVIVHVEIEGETWDLGSFPITGVVANRPRGTVELTLGDWAYRRAKPDGENTTTIGSVARTVRSVVEEYMGHVMPGGTFAVTVDDSNGALVQSPQEVSLGGNVWSALTTLANQVGCVIVMTNKNQGELRKFDPYAPYHDDLDGCVVGETLAVVADEAVNRVIVQGEMSNPGGDPTVYRSVKTLTMGPYKYDRDGIGKFALTETFRQPVVTQALVDAEAQRIYDRRVGIVRSQQVEIVPMPWLEVGDVVAYRSTPGDGPMLGLIDSMTFPMTAKGSQRLVLRDARIA